MSYRVVKKGEVESIIAPAVNAAGVPLTGKTDLYIRVNRGPNVAGRFLDWNDMTFKAVGWTTLDALLVEVDATNAPGDYELTGGLDTGAITNLDDQEVLTIRPLQNPGTDAKLSPPAELLVDPDGRGIDWDANERKQIRDALGVDGSKAASQNGQINFIRTRIN